MSNPSQYNGFMLGTSDEVALALVELSPGDVAKIITPDGTRELVVAQPVPRYHKFTVVKVPKGTLVRKGGEVIGIASDDVPEGSHLHVHNLQSARYRTGGTVAK